MALRFLLPRVFAVFSGGGVRLSSTAVAEKVSSDELSHNADAEKQDPPKPGRKPRSVYGGMGMGKLFESILEGKADVNGAPMRSFVHEHVGSEDVDMEACVASLGKLVPFYLKHMSKVQLLRVLRGDPSLFTIPPLDADKLEKLVGVLKEEMNVENVGGFILRSPRVVELEPERLRETLSYYKGLGIQGDALSKLLLRRPGIGILNLSVDENLAPKVKYLQSLGVPSSRILKLIQHFPPLLSLRVEQDLKPKLDLLVKSGVTGKKLEFVLGNPGFLVDLSLQDLERAAAYFADLGFRGKCFKKVLGWKFRVLQGDTGNLATVGRSLLESGFQKGTRLFETAFALMLVMNGDHVKTSLTKFNKFGISEIDAYEMFKRNPSIVYITVEQLEKKLRYLTECMELPLESIVKKPCYLTYSLEKRIRPRWEFMQLLRSEGCLPKEISPATLMVRTDEAFESFSAKCHPNAAVLYAEVSNKCVQQDGK